MVLRAAIFPAALLSLTGTMAWAQGGQLAPPDNVSTQDWNRSLMARGHASERQGQRDDALADYTLVIESHALAGDEQARAFFDRGLLLDGMDRLNDALGDYNAALSLAPKFTAALNNRANVYRRLGQLPEARRDYLASLAAGNPQSQYSYYGLGQIAEAEGNGVDAKELYARALANDPDYALARERLTALTAEDEMVHLRPPPIKTAQSGEGYRVAEAENVPVRLRPPDVPRAVQARLRPSGPEAVPASYAGGDLTLKPSLDERKTERKHGALVQLGAWRSREEATEGWDRAIQQAGDALENLSPRILEVDLPKLGRYYRLRVAAGQTGPKALCTALVAKGLDCIVARD
jgi:tetratricopeptide (TPR) repeat protein